VTIPEARRLQEECAGLVVSDTAFDFNTLARVAGTDISYIREDRLAIAVALSFSWPSLELEEERAHVTRVDFPYVPGLLSFRELPALLPAVRALPVPPQLIMVDGQGLAHPRSFGIASHLGVALGLPAVGCAKSRLVGTYEEPGGKRGDWSRLSHAGRVVGAVLRTRDGVKPVFVSVGHLIDLDSCIRAVLECGRGYRLPEPQRLAHALTARLKAAYREGGMPALEVLVSSLDKPTGRGNNN
jgi:deoxyribonuclease V